MLFTPIAALAAWTMAPAELPDLARWNEVALPGAPFRIDMPMPLKVEPDRINSGITTKTWTTAYGLMRIEISYVDRPGRTSFSARDNLEMLGGGLIPKWKNATAKVTDLKLVGYTAARLEMEHDVSSGRIRVEHVLIRVGEDDWTVQTTRFVGRDGETDSMHIFRSIKPPSPAPVLTPAKIGRLTIQSFGKPVVTQERGDANATFANWTTYAFDYQGTTKAWVYHIRMKPGAAFDNDAMMKFQADNVVNQSNPKPRLFPYSETIAGLPGSTVRGQAITGEGEECFRILTVGSGAEGWVMLIAGPNNARSETLFRDMIASIRIAP